MLRELDAVKLTSTALIIIRECHVFYVSLTVAKRFRGWALIV